MYELVLDIELVDEVLGEELVVSDVLELVFEVEDVSAVELEVREVEDELLVVSEVCEVEDELAEVEDREVVDEVCVV